MIRGIDFNENWKYHFGDIARGHLQEADETAFRCITLPHDFSVEGSFDPENGEACTGYLMGGEGWYRKHFQTTEEMADGKTFLNFDGIYERAHVYVNGELVDFHPYGYSPKIMDISGYLLEAGKDNLVAVHVDHTRYANSRWYTGSGIYRKVTMYVMSKVYIPVWGTQIDSKIEADGSAAVDIHTQVINETGKQQRVYLNVDCYDKENKKVANAVTAVSLECDEEKTVSLKFTIENPYLWEILKGGCYQAEVSLKREGVILQKETESFGVRYFRFDTEKGFFFNGVNTLIKGVCLHHDAGAVGAAVPLDVWRRRLENLISCGCNAIRTAHNPASEDFLNLCDELGLIVQEEFFDEWDNAKDKRHNGLLDNQGMDYITEAYTSYFRDYAKQDLQNTVKRDYNHPCIFQWSIGNEIDLSYARYNDAAGYNDAAASLEDGIGYLGYWYEMPPNSHEEIVKNIKEIPRHKYDIGSTANKLSKWVKELDTSRVVTSNCVFPEVGYETGLTDALDVVGFSYRGNIYDYCKEYYPEKPMLGTENVGRYREWKTVMEHEFIAGVFLWTGIDHMGEAWVQKSYPRKGSNLGLLDFAGNEKPSYYMFKSLWTDETVIRMETQTLEKSLYTYDEQMNLIEKEKDAWKHTEWHWQDVNPYWNYKEGEDVVIEMYSNCDSITLYLNDKEISTQELASFEDHIYKWCIPFEKGVLRAAGVRNGESFEEILATEDAPDHMTIVSDKKEIMVHPDSVAHVSVHVWDHNDNPVRNVESKITFTVSEGAKILGIDNGNPDNVEDYQNNQIHTWHGTCMLYVQALQTDTVEVKAGCEDMEDVMVTIEVR